MADMFRLRNKVALVIVGGGSIGETLALGSARQDAKVAISSLGLFS